MNRFITSFVALISIAAVGFTGDDHGHDHGAPAAATQTFAEVELNLKVVDTSTGKPVTGLNNQVSATVFKEKETVRTAPSHAEEDPGAYHIDQVFAEEGDYSVEWNVGGLKTPIKASFPLIVEYAGDEHAHEGSSVWAVVLTILGIAVLLVISFWVGRKSQKPYSTAASLALLSLLFSSFSWAEDEHGHDHGATAEAEAEPLQVGIGKLGITSQSQKVGDYEITLTIIVTAPDPNKIVLSEEQRKLLDLKTETIGVAEFGSGIDATGEAMADPARIADLSAQVSGKVIAVYANVGQMVNPGQTLATIEAPDVALAQSDYAAAQSTLLQAQANRQRSTENVTLAREALERQEELAKTGAFAQPSLQAARNELAQAQSEVAAASGDLHQAEADNASHRRELERVKNLFAQGLASRRELEAAELESKLDSERINQAKARVSQAEERLAISRETVKREEQIFKGGLLNRREIETARAEYKRAQAELRASETEVRGAQQGISGARQRLSAMRASPGSGNRVAIVAPIRGTVVKRQVNIGETVDPSKNLFQVLDDSKMWVEGDIFESDVARVLKGMAVQVRVQGDEGAIHYGKVDYISKVVDPEKRTAHIRVIVDNPDGSLKLNEFVQMLVVTNVKGRSLTLPEKAIQDVAGLKAVFVEHAGAFEKVNVKVGSSYAGRVEVTEGLEPGDKVVIQGAYQLKMMAVAK